MWTHTRRNLSHSLGKSTTNIGCLSAPASHIYSDMYAYHMHGLMRMYVGYAYLYTYIHMLCMHVEYTYICNSIHIVIHIHICIHITYIYTYIYIYILYRERCSRFRVHTTITRGCVRDARWANWVVGGGPTHHTCPISCVMPCLMPCLIPLVRVWVNDGVLGHPHDHEHRTPTLRRACCMHAPTCKNTHTHTGSPKCNFLNQRIGGLHLGWRSE